MRKLSIYCLVILFCFSLYHDLSKGDFIHESPKVKGVGPKDYVIRTIESGDTGLSVVEKINPHSILDLNQILKDFKKLNPEIKTTSLKIGKQYYFPIYSD